MIYSPKQKEKAVRSIARSAQQKISRKTGMTVNLLLCPAGTGSIKTPEHLLEVIAIALDMNMSCYKMRTRERSIVELRFIAALFMRMHFPYVTLQQIAGYFGGLDHSSVISGLARAHSLIYAGDAKFVKKYNQALAAVSLWLEKIGIMAA